MTEPKQSLGIRILIGLVSALVLAGTATIGVVVVGTQIGFYRARMGNQIVDYAPLPITPIDLAVFTPLATEGVAWMCTAMAVILVWISKPAGIWTRSMWVFSGIAAFVNAFKAVWVEHDLLGGIVTGGLSIAGPYVVHLFVIWVKHVRTGRTLDQVRIDTEIRWSVWGRRLRVLGSAALDHTVHPVTAVHTIWVWRAFRGITYPQAWVVASKPVRSRILARYRTEPLDGVPSVEERFLTDLYDDGTVKTLMHIWTADMLDGRAQGSTSGNTLTVTPDEHPPNRAPHTPKPSLSKRASHRPVDTSQARESATDTGVSKQDTVIAEYWRRHVNGDPVDGVNLSELARKLFNDPAARPTVSKTWNACIRGEHPNPKGGEQ